LLFCEELYILSSALDVICSCKSEYLGGRRCRTAYKCLRVNSSTTTAATTTTTTNNNNNRPNDDHISLSKKVSSRKRNSDSFSEQLRQKLRPCILLKSMCFI
jgi:hypothetical protein